MALWGALWALNSGEQRGAERIEPPLNIKVVFIKKGKVKVVLLVIQYSRRYASAMRSPI
jgi:hypothetical protein